MDALQKRLIWTVSAAGIALAAYIQDNQILVVAAELGDLAVEFNAIDSLVAVPAVFVHYDFCYARHAIVW